MSDKHYILVAEDDEFYGKIYSRKLETEGYESALAMNGKDLLEKAKQRKPDLIFLDLIMPEMDGFAALKALKADPDLKDIKVIVMSNLGQEDDLEKAKALGADDYLVKADVSIHTALEKLKEHLA